MPGPSFNDMAKSPSILSAERSPAATVAIAVLCLLGVVQLGTLAKTAWRKFVPAPPVAPLPTAPALPAVPAPALATSSGLPPLPDLGQTGLPPLPSLPGASGLPPLPAPALQAPPVSTPTAQPLVSASLPPPTATLPPAEPQAWVSAAKVEAAPPPPAAPRPKSGTGNPQVDELIEVAIDSRALDDMPGALQALERAELLLPDHPAILREKALTLGRMGQQAQAKALWDRAKNLGSPAPASSPSPLGSTAAIPPSSQEPLTLGTCQIQRDASVTSGQRLIVKLPVRSQPGLAIDPSAMNLDVFFYDRVDGSRVENTKADKPEFSFDMPVDFASGEEIISVIYHMPKLSPQEEAEIGRREFYGVVIKLYYQQKLVSTTAEPRDLLNPSSPQAGRSLPPAP